MCFNWRLTVNTHTVHSITSRRDKWDEETQNRVGVRVSTGSVEWRFDRKKTLLVDLVVWVILAKSLSPTFCLSFHWDLS